MNKTVLLYVFLFTNILFSQDVVLISEGFNNGATAPTGWVFNGIGSTYTTTDNYGAASPSLKLDNTDDYIETPLIAKPTQLTFWCKGQGTDANSSLKIYQFLNGNYQLLNELKPLPTTGQTFTYNLDTNATRIKFVYYKSQGNLSFDDVLIMGKPSNNNSGVINLSKNKYFLFSYIGASSDVKSYQVSANNLSNNLIITAPSSIYLSLDGNTNWVNSLQLNPVNGNINNTTIYFKFVPVTINNTALNISHTSGSITQDLVCYTVAGDTSNPFNSLKGTYKGKTLRYLLHNLIKNHTNIGYDNLWSRFVYTDSKESGKVWDIYSDNPSGVPAYEYDFFSNQCGNYNSEADCYNREHSWPKSWFNDLNPAYADLHHIYPTDGYVNNKRSDYPFSNVINPTYTSSNGSKLGSSSWSGFSGTAFEPRNEFKGDLARTYFYMSTRYIYEDNGWATSDATDKAEIKPWAVSLYLNWNSNDPVSQKELIRNCAVKNVQNNWNPFIFEPALAREIWDTTTAPTVISAQSLNNTDILLTFDRFVELNSSQNVNNYLINGIGNPVSAIRGYQGDPAKVLLKFNNLIAGNNYTIVINNVANLNGNLIANNTEISTGNILPVELKTFNAIPKNNGIVITWATASQINVDKFILQKSHDKLNWLNLATIKAKGNSNTVDEYQYFDLTNTNGKFYYRLLSIDNDGSICYSDIIETEMNLNYKFISKVYPNPFNPIAFLEFTLPEHSVVNINIYDILGRKIINIAQNLHYNAGVNLVQIEMDNYSNGTYFVEIVAKSSGKVYINRHKIYIIK